MRYCKQRLVNECGPVGVLNAMKWLGYPATYAKDIPVLRELTGFDPDSGIDLIGVSTALTAMGIPYRSKKEPIANYLLYDHLMAGGALLVSYLQHPHSRQGHLDFFFGSYMKPKFRGMIGAYNIEQVWYLKRSKK